MLFDTHPITLSQDDIRALWEGRKSEHRIALDPQPRRFFFWPLPNGGNWARPYDPWLWFYFAERGAFVMNRRAKIAETDRLWVREAFCLVQNPEGRMTARYRVDDEWQITPTVPWRSPDKMPRWESRLTLIVTRVQLVRLHDITEEGAITEGIEPLQARTGVFYDPMRNGHHYVRARDAYADLWATRHAKTQRLSWQRNPWVFVLRFDTYRRNIDDPELEEKLTSARVSPSLAGAQGT